MPTQIHIGLVEYGAIENVHRHNNTTLSTPTMKYFGSATPHFIRMNIISVEFFFGGNIKDMIFVPLNVLLLLNTVKALKSVVLIYLALPKRFHDFIVIQLISIYL